MAGDLAPSRSYEELGWEEIVEPQDEKNLRY